ncbi:MAG: hypothetical protein K2F90_00880 [Clostridiales bacterium]|nr:hypothetical protein [Clostridiales bacterium]
MNNLQLRKKILSVVVVFALALCLGLCAFLCINANSSRGTAFGASDSSGVLNSANGTDDADFTYQFGQTYTINGKSYTISNAQQSDYIPYAVALGLSDTVAVTRNKFYDVNGEDKTGSVGGVRSAGLYELTVDGTGQKYKVRVLPAKLDYSTTDVIPVFVNANSKDYRAHGDNTAVYKHNDGWYPSQKANEVPVEIRTITNSYYYLNNPTDQVTIKIGNEQFTDADGNEISDVTSAYSTLAYNDLIKINITDRAGVQYRGSNEYIATFTFNAPANCVFDYGDAGEDDEIADAHKGLSITQRTPTSFVLVKHWFLVNYTSLFVSQIEPTEDSNGLKETNDPYVPFHDKQKFDSYLDSLSKPSTWVGEGKNGESDTGTDTITYGDDLHVKTPRAKFRGDKYGTIKFDVIYVDLEGKTHRLVTDMQLGTTNTATTQRLDYYFNKTMPAGKYTLKLFGEINASQIAASEPNQIRGEYWLTVLPAPLDASLITGANGIQDAIKGTLQSNGEYINSYLLSENVLHKDLSEEVSLLNDTLNLPLSDGTIASYWRDLGDADKKEYYESAVTVKYNRSTWSSSNYVTYDEINQMITQAGRYTLYYSIAAKNYVTVGGPNDANRTAYEFTTRLSEGVSIKQIYDRVYNDDDPYFKNVAYTGDEVHTRVPRSQQYQESFDDKVDYINVREGASVSLTLEGELLTGWENDVAGGDLGVRIDISDDKQTLIVYFDIVPATNSFTVAPQIAPWTYDGFNKDINFIADGLAFDGADVYYRLGKKVGDEYEWVDVDGTLTVNDAVASEYFEVDADGKVSDEVATTLKGLNAGTYYLCGYINPSNKINDTTYNVNGYLMTEQAYSTVVVMQAANSWTITPYIIGWTYNGFSASTFQIGEARFGNNDDITYKLYEGNTASGTALKTFKTLDDIVDGEKISDTLNNLEVNTYTLTASLIGTDDYSALSMPMIFVVSKANNAWTTTPFINSWAYMGFAESNVRFGADRFNSQVEYGLYVGDTATDTPLYTFHSLTDIVKVDGKDVSVANMLKTLPAKTYTIVAVVADTDNYGGLSMPITFAVTKASNTWTAMPVMTGWAYKLFSESNFHAGTTELGSVSTITYKLHRGTTSSGEVLIDEFKTLNDVIDGKKVSDIFSDLPQGTYTLIAHQVGDDDYSELSQSMTFSVTQATNTWKVTPYITGWIYKQFTENNFQTGETEFGATADITYTLYAGTTTAGEVLIGEFKTLNDVKDGEKVSDLLNKLSKGTYTLLAHQDGTESYAILNTPLTFTVTPTTNSWSTKPRVIGWTYGSFDNSYFIAGVPTFRESLEGEVSAVVKYTLTKDGDDNFASVTFTQSDPYDFATLNAGNYTLSVYYAGTDNYEELTDEIKFTVGKYVNGWNPLPSLRGWDYKSFNTALFTAGVPARQDDTSAEVTYSVTGGTLTAAISLTVTDGALTQSSVDALTALAAGDYTFTATYPKTDNYDGITSTSTFKVSKIDNSWATRPRLLGWTYGAYDNGYFIAGVPSLKEGDSEVQYTLTKEGDNGFAAVTFTESDLYDFASLFAGTYTLKVSFAGTDNYEALDADDNVINFTVSQTNNYWQNATPPAIDGWTYGLFTDSLFTNGIPTYGTAATYTVRYVVNGNVDETENGIVKIGNVALKDMSYADLKAKLNGLNAGTYSIKATSGETSSFTAAEWSKQFAVAKTDNEWDTVPSITGWIYSQYDSTANAVNFGAAKHGNLAADDYTCKYFVAVNENGTWVKGTEVGASVIGTANAGDYLLEVTAYGDGNYNALVYIVSFVIGKKNPTWNTATTANNGKEYNWILGGTNEAVAQPVLGTPSWGKPIEYKLLNGDNELYGGSSWTGLENTLNSRKAGEYTVTAHVDGDTNYTALDYSVTVIISVMTNTWNDKVGNGTSEAVEIEKAYGEDLSFIEFTPTYGTVVITVNGKDTNDVIGYISSNGVGEYLIVATVTATDEYSALVDTVRLIITKANNSWNSDSDLVMSSEWEWNDVESKIDTGLTAATFPVPAQGSAAQVVVTVKATGLIVFESTVHYTDGNANVNDIAALNSRLRALDVVTGGYTITVTVGETDSYSALDGDDAKAKNFVVNRATNTWVPNQGPNVIVGGYGGSIAYPSATPTFGKNNVVFTYANPSANDKVDGNGNKIAPADDAVWENTYSYQAGSYWLRAYVAGTDNYTELVGYCLFSIAAGENAWVTSPGVIAWNWNGYDPSVNLFSGSGRNNQPAQFTITTKTGEALSASDFVAYDGTVISNGAINILDGFTLSANDAKVLVVSDAVAKLLNALKPNSYTLTVYVPAGDSLDFLRQSTTFTVGRAENGWKVGQAPAVSSYTYGSYNETTTFTYGETVYGDASAVIYKLDDELIITDASKPAYQKLQERLASLDVGSYTLSAWVLASPDGTYSALYSEQSPYTTRTFTVARATNGWTNESIVTQINKKYSEIKAAAFNQAEFAKLYAQLTPIAGTVNYALLNADYTSRNTDSLDYAGLFNAIKALPSGEYVIRASVAITTTDNYYGIGATDTRLIISTYDNRFTQIPDALTAQWACGLNEDNETVNKTVLNTFTIKAAHGEETVTYTLNKTVYESYADFKDAVSALNAGSYNVTIAIAATYDYDGASAVRMLTVSPADNSWQNDWVASGSLSVTNAAAKAGLSWDWNSTVIWTKAVPVYGKTVYVEIRKAGASSALQYVTLDYGVSNGDSAAVTISEAISKLDVGNYELIVSAPATVNWAALSDKVEFSIAKVENKWDEAPQISGAVNNKWAYGTPNVLPTAKAKYGNVRYEYTTASGDKLTSMPTAVGEYVIKFIVDKTANYDEISKTLNVTIEKATNRAVTNLGMIGWTWGSFDREINVITGTPEIAELEKTTIKFSIGTGMGDSFKALPDLSEFSLTANGLVQKDSKVEAALRKLTGGTSKDNNLTYYTIRMHVEETTNYNGFTADNRFAVTGAINTFTKYPTIKSWEVNHWTDELPSAVALYGAPAITITGDADGIVYFKGEYKKANDSDELELVVELNNLNLAPKGEYVLTALVNATVGQYNSPLVGDYRFSIGVKGAGQSNHWEELPTIKGWVANIDGLFNAPSGTPLRGLPNFVFYVRNEDGSRGKKVDASMTNVVLKKGSKYESDIYIPVEYGSYILVASSNGIPEEDGKSDALAEYEIPVIIDPRPLSFDEELRISTLLYLGERKDWADPTVKPSIDDAEISYVYTNKETGISSKQMPTDAGDYTVTVTLSALYSRSISMSVDFTVKLSPNGWTAAPNIKDWSAEDVKGNLPTGAASVGSDQIVYTYVNVNNPNKILTERPTTEGSYIMYADLNVAGYEPLHAEYRFTIGPAFDRQLVIAAIVLGVFACMLACVVIYFAIKRYKEN